MATSVCQNRYSVDASGKPPAERYFAACRCHCCTDSAQSQVTSLIGVSRARASSERLVSCVDSVVIVPGQSSARRAAKVWNSSALTPKCSGSPPTSFSEISRW